MTSWALSLVLSVASAGAWAQSAPQAWVAGARGVAQAVPAKLLDTLNGEIAKSGVLGALDVCHDKAPLMAQAASEKTGWTIRRVSLKNRNPKAVPDAWERAALEDFDRRAAAGEAASGLEKAEVVQGERRYIKALPVQQVCLACHGAPEKIPAEVTQRLHTLYPQDLATGYAIGQLRGAITLRQPGGPS